MPEKNSSQPKIAQRMAIRTLVLLLVLGGMYQGFQYFQSVRSDLGGLRKADSEGMIAAIEYANDGSKAVILDPKGEISTTKSWKEGIVDRDQVWSPDGHFLYFCSDRKDHSFHIFRWSPGSPDAEQRSIAKSGRSHPFFAADLPASENESMLLIGGGVVRGMNPKDSTAPQYLPPMGAEVVQTQGGEEGAAGTEGAFAAAYGQLGNSFRIAKWLKHKKYIATVMGRDSGEALIIQDMTPKEGKLPKPMVVVAAEHIDITVSPATGALVYAVQGLKQSAEELKSMPKGTKVYRNFVGIVDPEDPASNGFLLKSTGDESAYGMPAVSPDGTQVAITEGALDASAGLKPGQLILTSTKPNSLEENKVLSKGEVFEPSWSPKGDQIVFAKRINGKRDICVVSKTGGDEKNLTNGKGNYGWPMFSPQLKSAK